MIPDSPSLSETIRRKTNKDKFIPTLHVVFAYEKLVRMETSLPLPFILMSLVRVYLTMLVVATIGEVNERLAFIYAPNLLLSTSSEV